jgi:hypothetical protein
MPPHLSKRMSDAAENLKRMLDEIAPYEKKKATFEEPSTAGTWRATEESQNEFCFVEESTGQ